MISRWKYNIDLVALLHRAICIHPHHEHSECTHLNLFYPDQKHKNDYFNNAGGDKLNHPRITHNIDQVDRMGRHYYPYGSIMPGRSLNYASVDGRYKFTGKERDSDTGYDYFGARYYDSWMGRWLSVDPLAKKYPG